ncbi:FERM domain-containing protein 7 [Cichlidogyrus casuarinus]|uniref:FERM domain-containing protein 7 n=1 Tax=Cichlidogyrus casuarinus TaxID=1844966 RepID=A0ABD2QKC8_9PLAT
MEIVNPPEFELEVGCVSKLPRQKIVTVCSLDDTHVTILIPVSRLSCINLILQVTASGAELFVAVVSRLKILEADYFDLDYIACNGSRQWIDHTKPMNRQLNVNRDLNFRLSVKFYVPHPNLLEEEYTRYLFALQIKRDLVDGTLECSNNTAAILASYLVQSEVGDFLEDEYRDISYLANLKVIRDPNEEKLTRIRCFHQNHIGMSPSDADYALLDTARKVDFYGVHLHNARDQEELPIGLTVTHAGILVFQNSFKMNTFSWAKICKLNFKRRRFFIKLHPDTIEFFFDERGSCKDFWKRCIEHHAFFRCAHNQLSVHHLNQGKVLSRGSAYRYIGRTQKELSDFVRSQCVGRKCNFKRNLLSKPRYVSSIIGGGAHASYANTLGRKFASASMTLRSKSLDSRRRPLEKTFSYQDNFHKQVSNPSGYSTMPSSHEGPAIPEEEQQQQEEEEEDTGVSLRDSSEIEDLSREVQLTVQKLTEELKENQDDSVPPVRTKSTPHLADKAKEKKVSGAASQPQLSVVNPLFMAQEKQEEADYIKMADLLLPKVDAMHLIDSARYQQLASPNFRPSDQNVVVTTAVSRPITTAAPSVASLAPVQQVELQPKVLEDKPMPVVQAIETVIHKEKKKEVKKQQHKEDKKPLIQIKEYFKSQLARATAEKKKKKKELSPAQHQVVKPPAQPQTQAQNQTALNQVLLQQQQQQLQQQLQQLYASTAQQATSQQFLYRGSDGYVYAFPISMLPAQQQQQPQPTPTTNYAFLQQPTPTAIPMPIQPQPILQAPISAAQSQISDPPAAESEDKSISTVIEQQPAPQPQKKKHRHKDKTQPAHQQSVCQH